MPYCLIIVIILPYAILTVDDLILAKLIIIEANNNVNGVRAIKRKALRFALICTKNCNIIIIP